MQFIHGADFSRGSAREPLYNLSFIVDRSVQLGHPVVAVSFNYHLSVWGFIFSNQLRDTGATNIGPRDQRAPLAWIQGSMLNSGAILPKPPSGARALALAVSDSRLPLCRAQ
ncbi:hypothetical protein BDW60DRAFT_206334 [Aspergillus nidulans var. acristatus]